MAKKRAPRSPRRLGTGDDSLRPVELVRPDKAIAAAPPVAEAEDPEADPVRREAERKRQLVQQALDHFQLSEQAYHDQRQRELDDLEFDLGEQWLKEHKDARAAHKGIDGIQVPARPCLTINKLDQPIQQVIAEARMARLAIEIKPRGNGATKDTAEVRQGLIRNIEVESRAAIGRMWALDRVAKCGRGAYRILKHFANDGDFQMDLVVARILNQHSVYPDPYAVQPDWSDGRFCLITSDLPESEYKRLYPKSRLSRIESNELTALGDQQQGWVTTADDGQRTFRVAEYFYVVYETRTLIGHDKDKPFYLDELAPEEQASYQAILDGSDQHGLQVREVEVRKVKWALINALEVLDEEDWEGSLIPVVMVVGKEYNVNGKRVWKGIVSNSKDAQRAYNVMRSEQMAAIGAGSKATWVMADGQDESYETMWDSVNNVHYTRVKYKPVTFDGQLVPPPHRDVAEPPIQAITLAGRDADMDIKATTGRFDPSLGRTSGERSGRAIRELKVQGETGTSNYLDNLATISMTLEGRILNEMLKHVYFEPGRIVRILGEEDEEREVMLNQPYLEGPDGAMLPVTEPEGGGPALGPDGQPVDQKKLKKYDLNVGEHRVIVSVGPQVQTQREEDRLVLNDLAQAWPEGVQFWADLWVGAHPSKAARTIAERLKKIIPGAKDEDKPQEIPPEVQREVEQMKAVMQEMAKKLQEAQQAIATDAAKTRAQVQMKAMELASREKIALMEARIDLMKKRAELEANAGLAFLDAQIADADRQATQQHEATMLLLEKALTPEPVTPEDTDA